MEHNPTMICGNGIPMIQSTQKTTKQQPSSFTPYTTNHNTHAPFFLNQTGSEHRAFHSWLPASRYHIVRNTSAVSRFRVWNTFFPGHSHPAAAHSCGHNLLLVPQNH